MQKKNPKHEMTLTSLQNNEIGIVTSIKNDPKKGGGRSSTFKMRLLDMGLTPGVKVIVVKSAPFNGPLEIIVRGSRLVLGRRMAKRILVEKEKNG